MAHLLKQIAVRLPVDLILRAQLHAVEKGYKFQAMVAIALTQFLDREGAAPAPGRKH
jgi:hypothetical protein